MELSQEPKKTNAGRPRKYNTEDEKQEQLKTIKKYQVEYHKTYRANNPEYINNLGKNNYYNRKYGLDEELKQVFAEHTGSVFKIKKTFSNIIKQNPELKTQIISLLEKIE